jgi:hypothetical protein
MPRARSNKKARRVARRASFRLSNKIEIRTRPVAWKSPDDGGDDGARSLKKQHTKAVGAG